MTFQAFILAASQFAVVATVLSLAIEWTKRKIENAKHRMLYALLISVVGGVGISFAGVIPASWWQQILAMVGSVNTAYLLVVRYLPIGTTTEE